MFVCLCFVLCCLLCLCVVVCFRVPAILFCCCLFVVVCVSFVCLFVFVFCRVYEWKVLQDLKKKHGGGGEGAGIARGGADWKIPHPPEELLRLRAQLPQGTRGRPPPICKQHRWGSLTGTQVRVEGAAGLE